MTSSDLYARRVGQGLVVVLLHGLFGSGANLGALARSLRESFLVYSPDLPNHGRSPWLDGPELPGMARVLHHWMAAEGIGRAHLVGHSLGGKVAMQLALSHPDRVRSLVVADIAPVDYPPRHDSVFAALQAVAATRCESRQAAAEVMAGHIQESGVIQFLLASLQSVGGGAYRWRFNLDGLRVDYPALCEAPSSAGSYQGPVCFIKGSESDYILEEHREGILSRFPGAQLKVIPGCGHWLHAEKPEMFNRLVSRFLDTSTS